MLFHHMGMEAQEHRCCLFHFLYNLLRELCLEFLFSLELVVILASVFAGVAFILLCDFSLTILCKGLACLLSFLPRT